MYDWLTRREYLVTGVLAGAAGLTGCAGSGSDDEPTDGDDEAANGTPTVSPSVTLTPDSGRGTDGGSGGARAETSQFTADDVESGDRFGETLACSGDGSTAIVGAPSDAGGDGEPVGSAYVFDRAQGDWTQATKLGAPAGDDVEEFGNPLTISRDGTTALLGSDRYSERGAYVFAGGDGEWRQQARLSTEGRDGASAVAVSADGSTACVGNADTIDGGVVDVYTRSDGTWAHGATLSPSGQYRDDWFGEAVALSDDGSTALVGAKFNDEPGAEWAGAAYLFSRADDGWTDGTKLLPEDSEGNDFFGEAVALTGDGERALIGATGASNGSFSSGGAYVFTGVGGSWTQQRKLVAPTNPIIGAFGESVALAEDGTAALVGAANYESRGTEDAGGAYLFTRADGTWSGAAKLAAGEPTQDASFGESVALAGDGGTALVGAGGSRPSDDRDIPGSAYVFDV